MMKKVRNSEVRANQDWFVRKESDLRPSSPMRL